MGEACVNNEGKITWRKHLLKALRRGQQLEMLEDPVTLSTLHKDFNDLIYTRSRLQ